MEKSTQQRPEQDFHCLKGAINFEIIREHLEWVARGSVSFNPTTVFLRNTIAMSDLVN